MSTKALALSGIALFALSASSFGYFEDYYYIGETGSGSGSIQLGVTSSQDLPAYFITTPGPNANTYSGSWNFSSTSIANPANAARGQFQRMPGPVGAEANGFSITAQSSAFLQFKIDAPWAYNPGPNTPVAGHAPQYNFTWNIFEVAQPGVEAYWIDSTGTHPITTQIGSGIFTSVYSLSSADVFGFYLKAPGATETRPIGLNVQGWQAVPEPSSVAMGLMASIGALGFAYRRYRVSKS